MRNENGVVGVVGFYFPNQNQNELLPGATIEAYALKARDLLPRARRLDDGNGFDSRFRGDRCQPGAPLQRVAFRSRSLGNDRG